MNKKKGLTESHRSLSLFCTFFYQQSDDFVVTQIPLSLQDILYMRIVKGFEPVNQN